MAAKEQATPRTKTSDASVMKNTGEGIVEDYYRAIWSCLVSTYSNALVEEGVKLDSSESYFDRLAELRC